MSVCPRKVRSVGTSFLIKNDCYVPVCQRKIPPYISVLLHDLIVVQISNNTVPVMETDFAFPYYHLKDKRYLCYVRKQCVPLTF